jgi:carbamoyl-phosphate synthase small subunit
MQSSIFPTPNAILLFEDGTEFQGYGIGAEGIAFGELCFNTAMNGYQEILTDPSYYGQIITFTTPHIGNVGVNNEDYESMTLKAQGLVVRELPTDYSNWRAESDFNTWLINNEITGIAGIDTRQITNYIRREGHPKVAIAFHESGLNQIDRGAIIAQLFEMGDMTGAELTHFVRTDKSYEWAKPIWQFDDNNPQAKDAKFHVVAIDYGAKLNILRHLVERGCKVTVVGGNSSLSDILALQPDGVFLSNGPGDPAATGAFAVDIIKGLIEKNVPIFGICLGHQLLALALGAKTEKLYQGHRGANHPVKDLRNGKVEITSQNHGFVVQSDTLPDCVDITHISLFDGTIEGVKHKTKQAFSVQYHPESSPGPHDSLYLFDNFMAMMS